MKLEHRLALLTGTVTAASIATALGFAFFLVRHSALRELDEVVIDGAKAAAIVVGQDPAAVARDGGNRALLIPDDVALMVQRVVVYAADGKRVASRPEGIDVPADLRALAAQTGARMDQPFDLPLVDGPMRAVLTACRKARGVTILHAVSSRQLEEIIASRARIFSLLFVCSLIVVLVPARWLGRRLASDVERLTGVARRVASGELSARAGTVGLASPETRNLARELDHMIGELATLMESQRNFISYAAHELRSPLTAIQGEVQLALRRPRSEEAYVETLGGVLSEVAALTQLAEDLLTLARAQANSAVSETAVISEVIDDAVRWVQGAAQIQDARIEVDHTKVAGKRVTGRRSDLSRVLRNLLENAIKFGPVGGVVQVDGYDSDGNVVVAVRDFGGGVPAKDQPGIFEPFYRASDKNTSRTSGTGLGLAIAREIARKSGGDINLDGTCPVGARFCVSFRAAE